MWTTDHGFDNTLKAFEESKSKLGLDTIDLYLIHWPANSDFSETWRALERLSGDGQVRAIGVYNFLAHHLETLLETAEIIPRSTQEAHIRENSDVFDFELSSEDMSRLDALDEGKRVGPDPDTFVGYERSPTR